MNFDIEKYPKKKETAFWVGALIAVAISLPILAVTFYVLSLGEPAASYHVEQSQ